jgi:hypothetical protein
MYHTDHSDHSADLTPSCHGYNASFELSKQVTSSVCTQTCGNEKLQVVVMQYYRAQYIGHRRIINSMVVNI